MIEVIQVIAIFLVPLLIIRYHNFRLTKLIGTIGMAYLLGLIVSALIYLINVIGPDFSLNTDVGEIGSFAAISIAIPLLLFSANLKEAKKLSKIVLLSFLSLIVSTIIITSIGFYLYGKYIVDGAIISAMAVSVYTGGTPNLNAIANIFGLAREAIVIVNISEMIIGAIFYMFLLLLSKPILIRFLKSSDNNQYLIDESRIQNTEDLGKNRIKISRALVITILIALGMAVVSALVGIVFWMLSGAVDGTMIDALVPALLIGVTILGIAASFNKKIREVEGTNVAGQYLILVFSFALASSINFGLIQGQFMQMFIYYGLITLGVFVLHILIARILRIDVDCTIVTITAGLYGPAFIPAITKQIKNDALTVPGLICGSIGYAIGTFLGLALGLLFLL